MSEESKETGLVQRQDQVGQLSETLKEYGRTGGRVTTSFSEDDIELTVACMSNPSKLMSECIEKTIVVKGYVVHPATIEDNGSYKLVPRLCIMDTEGMIYHCASIFTLEKWLFWVMATAKKGGINGRKVTILSTGKKGQKNGIVYFKLEPEGGDKRGKKA